MTLHGPHTRQLDNGEDRPEDKLESLGWMASHGPHTRQLDNGEDRPEGKLESGLDDITWTSYKATG